MKMRRLGSTDIELSPVGFGCWAIGGLFKMDGLSAGWGNVDDGQSIRAIRTALENGINFFDTADTYGTGHSEELIGRALNGRRHEAVIATKFGYTYDPDTRQIYSKFDLSPTYIRSACQASLKRLGTDYIDLYQIHVGGISNEEIETAVGTLDELKSQGLIRSYGFSTWDVERAEQFAKRSSGVAIQHPMNVLSGDSNIISLCERDELSSINNSPLAMGLLSGKFTQQSRLAEDDVRGSTHEWVQYFKDGKPKPEFLEALDSVREILTTNNRTLVQGALAWLWGKSNQTVPIPGLKTVKQVEEAAQAMSFGPLTQTQVNEVEQVLNKK